MPQGLLQSHMYPTLDRKGELYELMKLTNQAVWRYVWDGRGALPLGKAPRLQPYNIRICEVVSLLCYKPTEAPE